MKSTTKSLIQISRDEDLWLDGWNGCQEWEWTSRRDQAWRMRADEARRRLMVVRNSFPLAFITK